MTLLKETYLLLWKDLLLELRRRESLLTMFFFGTLLLFVFHFSFDLAPDKIVEMAPALLWLAFLFTGTLGLAQLFNAERENHCLDALLLSPLDRGALFLAKAAFNLILMLLVEIVVIPLFWILFNLPFMEFATANISGYLIGYRWLLCAGNDHVGGHAARPGARAVAAAGAVSFDDSGHTGDDPLHGRYSAHRRDRRGAPLAAAAFRF